MFTIAELKSYVESVVPYTYYHNEFPASSVDNSGYVRIHGGFRPDQWTNKRRPSIQIVVRGKNGIATEALANTIYDEFHRRQDFVIGSQRIVATFADQSAPLYLGMDANNRPMYSVNFTATLLAK
ncbi:minor capsid protein [Paenibacillus sp. NPDC057967]|uniref:minor capsid protein n=1 Tax=Paenibacillus sp. NPDC057967 TaxID=3346293 RepID=UPI0036D9F68E